MFSVLSLMMLPSHTGFLPTAQHTSTVQQCFYPGAFALAISFDWDAPSLDTWLTHCVMFWFLLRSRLLNEAPWDHHISSAICTPLSPALCLPCSPFFLLSLVLTAFQHMVQHPYLLYFLFVACSLYSDGGSLTALFTDASVASRQGLA